MFKRCNVAGHTCTRGLPIFERRKYYPGRRNYTQKPLSGSLEAGDGRPPLDSINLDKDVRRRTMNALVTTLCRRGWLQLIQGAFSIVIGILVLVWPGRRFFTLILFFGLLMLLNGVVAIGAAVGAA